MKRIGIIGVGGVANGTHLTQLLTIENCEITAICDINPDALERTGKRVGLDKSHCFSGYRELIDSGLVDAVEICTPNHMHVEIAKYAVSRGLGINSEKPLGITAEECLSLSRILEEHPVPNMMSFSYRFFSAVRYAKWILDKGLIGDISGIQVEYLKSSAFIPGRRLDWRFVKKYAGTGVLGDLGAHLIDMARLLIGEFKSVNGMLGIVVKKRQRLESEEWAEVETDDYCNFMANIENSRTGDMVPASFVITRCAIAHQNTIKFNVFGSEGAISFNLNNPDELQLCVGEIDKDLGKLRSVEVPERFRIRQEQAFVNSLYGDYCDYYPTIQDGIACQKILDAVLESAETTKTIEIK